MANGTILDGFLLGGTPDLAAGLPGDHILPALAGWLTDDLDSGTLTDHQPISIRSVAKSGAIAASFANDWFNRIHIAPSAIAFGAIAGGAASGTIIWNAYLTSSTLSGITAIDDDGLTLSGVSVPKIYKPLEYTVLQITADADGPMQVNAEYDFAFTGLLDSIVLTVTGARSHLWPFAPNWRQPVDVNLEFLTDLITSRSGREQRRSLRRTPRRQIQYMITLDSTESQLLRRSLATWQSRAWVMGDPVRRVRATDGAPDGATQFAVDDLPAWLAVGEPILIGDTVLTIDEVDPDTNLVTITAPLTQTLAPGTVIRPALSGHLSASLSATHPSSGTTQTQITLDVTPGSEPADEGGPGYGLLDGREVFLPKPNWGETVSDQFNWPSEKVDFGFGKIESFNPVTFGTIVRNATFVSQTPMQAIDLEQFFNRSRGRRGEYLMPTWMNDLPPKTALIQGTDFIRIEGADAALAYADDSIYQAVAVVLTGNRRIYRKVDTISTVSDLEGTDTVIHFSGNWLADVDLNEVLMVSWLNVVRFASDQLTIEWLTSDVAQAAIAMQTLEYLAAENPITDLEGAAQWVLEVWGPDDGIRALESLDFVVNIGYASIYYIPEAWAFWHESVIDSLRNWIVLYREVTT